MFDPYYLLSVIIFFAALGLIIYKDRKNMEFKYILVMRRTKRFRNFIDSIAKKAPSLWKSVGGLAIIVCFCVMAFALFTLAGIVHSIYIGEFDQPALQFILPTPSPVGSMGPGYILLPFWPWIITIFCILVPHELLHGILARAEKIKLKSVGLLMLAIFPGAFVEPEEKQLKRAKFFTKLRIFSAGSFANFITSLLIFLFITLIFWPMITNPTITLTINDIDPNSPAAIAGLKPNMTITEINGKTISVSYLEYVFTGNSFSEELGTIRANDEVTMKADGNLYTMVVGENPETGNPYVGVREIQTSQVFTRDVEFLGIDILQLLTMIFLFSFLVGMVNILPIFPLDGGLMIQAITDKFAKKKSKQIVMAITYIMLIVLIYSFIGPYITF